MAVGSVSGCLVEELDLVRWPVGERLRFLSRAWRVKASKL
jgi:hypothetical protein